MTLARSAFHGFQMFSDWIQYVQKCADLEDLNKMLQNKHLLAKDGSDRAEEEPSKSIFLYFLKPKMLKY